MKEQGLHLGTHAYNIDIDGFCKSGKVNKAYQLLEEMKTKGLQPTVVTYGSVIDGLAKIDRLDEAYMLFEEAKSKGADLNVAFYSSLIDVFGKVGRIETWKPQIGEHQENICKYLSIIVLTQLATYPACSYLHLWGTVHKEQLSLTCHLPHNYLPSKGILGNQKTIGSSHHSI